MKLCLKGTHVTWYSSVDLNINVLSCKFRYLAAFEHFLPGIYTIFQEGQARKNNFIFLNDHMLLGCLWFMILVKGLK